MSFRVTRRTAKASEVSVRTVEGRQERTFITFENDIEDKVFNSIFTKSKKGNRKSQLCVITRQPAKYFDPVTQLPFRNIQAFKVLREAYYLQLEELENKTAEVNTFLEWRKKIKANRVASTTSAAQ